MEINAYIGLILSAVLVIVTAVYTWINWKLLQESIATRRQKNSPNIVPYLKSSDNHEALFLYVKNMGEGCAKDVKIKVIKDYNRFCGKEQLLSQLNIFKEGVNIFPSGYELHYGLNWWEDITNKGMSDYIELEVRFKDLNDNQYGPNTYTLKFSQIESTYITPPETHIGRIAYYLKQINNTIGSKII